MCSGVGDWTCLQPGFPIRTSSDHSSVASSSRLIAGSYVLLRLLVPRHPPCALTNLTTKILDARVHCAVLKLRAGFRHQARACPRERTVRRKEAARAPTQQGRPVPAMPAEGWTVRPFPQDPTACRGRPPHRHRSGPANQAYWVCSEVHGQLVDLPPMSNHPETRARVVALDAGTGARCSLERR